MFACLELHGFISQLFCSTGLASRQVNTQLRWVAAEQHKGVNEWEEI